MRTWNAGIEPAYLCPPIHATRHNDLRDELLRNGHIGEFPFLKQRQESESKPVWPHSVRVERPVELLWGDIIEETGDVVGSGRIRWPFEGSGEDAGVVEEGGNIGFALG